MIKKITKIKNYGIFRDFTWKNLPEFGKSNLIYGLNGSGKSTFATIFDDIKNREQRYFKGEFRMTDTELGEITSNKLSELNCNLYVFNTHFIQDNIGEFSHLKGIVYLSELNKNAKQALETQKAEKEKLTTKYIQLQKAYEIAEKNYENALISSAKSIKEEFHVIGGVANTYTNYNKSSFRQAAENYGKFLEEQHNLKDIIAQTEYLKKELRDEIKAEINFDTETLRPRDIDKMICNTKKILGSTIKKRIQEKIDDTLFSWLEEGYRLHKSQNHCLYCGSIISTERQQYLNDLFNSEVSDLQTQLGELQNKVQDSLLPESNLTVTDFYASLNEQATDLLQRYNTARKIINDYLHQLLELIVQKRHNPFEPVVVTGNIDDKINECTTTVDNLRDLIQHNNDITAEFASRQMRNIKEIEKRLVYTKYKSGNIAALHKSFKNATQNLKDVQVEIDMIDQNISLLENELVDVLKASSNFNELLAQFLGRDELELKYEEQNKGYRIIRKESGNEAKQLSEGEKTAIAFIYFLTKVKENGNNIANSIIVFDDPISSFDSNHMFNAYAFIETYFKDCKQLFVLTHNFGFFKLLRKNLISCKCQMYLIENSAVSSNRKIRTAAIVELPKSIRQASSEYHYLFEKVYNFNKNYDSNVEIEFNDYLQLSNICRKLLETFSTFKIPNGNNFAQRLEALYKCNKPDGYTLTTEEQNEYKRIYRFVNNFSHNNNFGDAEETDFIFGELHAVVSETLALIERTDRDHYNNLVKFVS